MGLLPSYFTVQLGLAPMPVPLMQALREIEVETAVGRASIFRLHFDLSRNIYGDFDALALGIFRPNTPVTIRISLGLAVPQTIVNGYVQNSRMGVRNEPGASTLEVVGSDALGTLMGLIERPFTWPNAPDSEVAAAIFANYGILPDVMPTPPLRTAADTTTTTRATDAAILDDLASAHSYELYIQPDPLVGRDIGHFHRRPTGMPPQAVLSIDFGRQTNLASFDVANDMLRPTSVAMVASDPQTRAPIPITAAFATDLPMGREPTLNRIVPPPVERPVGSLCAASPAEAQARAFARTVETSHSVTANGSIDGLKFNRVLLAGQPVAVRGAGQENSGIYYVDQVTHRISRDDYAQSFSCSRNALGLTGAEIFTDAFAMMG